MARLRFPGRPGHRFDRISVRYFEDDVKNISDPAIAFLPQFQRGLQLFRELVGESDEVNIGCMFQWPPSKNTKYLLPKLF